MTTHTMLTLLADKLRSYLRLTQAKLLIWGVFLTPYVLVMIFYSGALPHKVQVQIHRLIYSSTLSLAKILPAPNPRLGAYQATNGGSDPEQLTIGYFLVTYLWACILVESFGILVGQKEAAHGKKSLF